jgi:hypothetical protein
MGSRYNDVTLKESCALAQNSTGIYSDLVLNFRMSRGGLVLALGLLSVCFTVAAQQAKRAGGAQHAVAVSAVTALSPASSLTLDAPKTLGGTNNSLLFHNGPVRAWSDGGQLVSETALVQIGMAPLGLFPVTYLATNDAGPVPTKKSTVLSNSRSENLSADGKALPGEMMASPLNNVYCTGEVGFMYGQWSGKASGDYVGSYVWGQTGNDKFQITAGASFENWDGHGTKFRSFSR